MPFGAMVDLARESRISQSNYIVFLIPLRSTSNSRIAGHKKTGDNRDRIINRKKASVLGILLSKIKIYHDRHPTIHFNLPTISDNVSAFSAALSLHRLISLAPLLDLANMKIIVVPQIVAVNLCDIVAFRLFSAYSILRILLQI